MNDLKKIERYIGKCGQSTNDPTLICLGGIHGNEPAGIHAIQNVLKLINDSYIELKGTFIGLAGNLSALSMNKRFVDIDLNRVWNQFHVDDAKNNSKRYIEYKEQLELRTLLDKIIHSAKGDVFFIDLHTSGAAGEPFACIGDNLRNRKFAFNLPIPIILGLEEQLDGALLEYVNDKGAVTIGVEGGYHDSPDAAEYMMSVILISMANMGMLDKSQIDFRKRYYYLEKRSEGIPRVLEVRHRHGVDERNQFKMVDGYVNFQKIAKGDFLAIDHGNKINAIKGGRILLPLYQALGNDGFFITRQVNKIWLTISKILRYLSIDQLFYLLPGVKRHSIDNSKLIINKKIARWFATEAFHLLGYRKIRIENGILTAAKRK